MFALVCYESQFEVKVNYVTFTMIMEKYSKCHGPMSKWQRVKNEHF